MAACHVVQLGVSERVVNLFVILLDRKGLEHNIVDMPFALELLQAVHRAHVLAARGDIDLVVVCSGKNKSFLAGADINHELKFVGSVGAIKAYSDCWQFSGLLCKLEALPVPTVAVLNGIALGGGLEIALACDYRVADQTCKQIGLPEVKIGVLPGGGGCCRLPLLIGFVKALPLLVSGGAVTAQQALRMGLVDMLWANTRSSKDQYSWIAELRECLVKGKIGQKRLSLQLRVTGEPTPDTSVLMAEQFPEDELKEVSWEECELKAVKKYAAFSRKFLLSAVPTYCLNWLLCRYTFFSLWRKIGCTMPAPYVCLEAAWHCYNSSSWFEAISVNSVHFARLACLPETKSLMNLFLIARQLKKQALQYGGNSQFNQNRSQSETIQGTQSIDMQDSTIVVIAGKEGLDYTSSFIQGLLYANMDVAVLLANKNSDFSLIKKKVERLFLYAVKRGFKNADKRVREGLSLVQPTVASEEVRSHCIVISMVSEDDLEERETLRSFKVHLLKIRKAENVVFLDSIPRVDGNGYTPVCLGDTLRKNTLSVELSVIQPPEEEATPNQITLAANLVSSFGKVPVVSSPLSQSLTPGWFLCLWHWSLAAKLHTEAGIPIKYIDSSLILAGYTKGPFAIMKQIGTAILLRLAEAGQAMQIDCATALLCYLKKKGGATVRDPKCPPPHLISFLFTLNLVNAASYLLTQESSSVDVIDFLAVSNLVHFPPTEGGPINYLRRNRVQYLQDKLSQLKKYPSTSSIVDKVCQDFEQLTTNLQSTPASEASLLSNAELRRIGPARGVVNIKKYLFPVSLQLMLLFFTAICVGLVYSVTCGGSLWSGSALTLGLAIAVAYLLK